MTERTIDWTMIRLALRRARLRWRDRHGSKMTLDRLGSLTHLNRVTIHRIENVRRYPKYRPDLETVATITHALGLPLSELFLQVEFAMASTSVGVLEELNAAHVVSVQRPVAPSDPRVLAYALAIANNVIDHAAEPIRARLAAAITRLRLASSNRPVSDPGAPPAGAGGGVSKGHPRPTGAGSRGRR